ncbi:MAG TPA: hypothetical protein VE777_11030 [Gaiellales bacterium]|nr:hypothetical protein [Gaiellales bacterium]
MCERRLSGAVRNEPAARPIPPTDAVQRYRVPGSRPVKRPPRAAAVVPSGAVAVSETRRSPEIDQASSAVVSPRRMTNGPRVNGSPLGPSR